MMDRTLTVLDEEPPPQSLPVLLWCGPQAPIAPVGVLERPPQPDARQGLCVDECAVLMRDDLPADVGLLQAGRMRP